MSTTPNPYAAPQASAEALPEPFTRNRWVGVVLGLLAPLVTLQRGDHIAVSKRAYGWTNPLTGERLVRFAPPARGDVAVFRYPVDRDLSYVMRVVGLPGDTVRYAGKRLSINGVELPVQEEGPVAQQNAFGGTDALVRYRETLGKMTHAILLDPSVPPYRSGALRDFPGRERCRFDDGIACNVPAEHYFVMGDNRDNSDDSRYWGFVPEEDFIGRVFLVWYSRDPERAGARVE